MTVTLLNITIGKSPCLKNKYQYLIKSYKSDKQPNICFRQCVPTYVSLPNVKFVFYINPQIIHILYRKPKNCPENLNIDHT